VLPVCGRFDLGLIVRGSESLDFFSHTISHALEHSATSSENNVPEKVLLDVTVTFHDGVVGELVNSVLVVVVLLSIVTVV
jgi:hypothetical protein